MNTDNFARSVNVWSINILSGAEWIYCTRCIGYEGICLRNFLDRNWISKLGFFIFDFTFETQNIYFFQSHISIAYLPLRYSAKLLCIALQFMHFMIDTIALSSEDLYHSYYVTRYLHFITNDKRCLHIILMQEYTIIFSSKIIDTSKIYLRTIHPSLRLKFWIAPMFAKLLNF